MDPMGLLYKCTCKLLSCSEEIITRIQRLMDFVNELQVPDADRSVPRLGPGRMCC